MVKMENKKLNEGYKRRGENSFLWKSKAESLAKAAIALWNCEIFYEIPTYGRSSMILMGLSLENLLKGILLNSGKYPISQGIFPREIKSHNLYELCEKAGITIKSSYEEKIFLQRLSEQVDWAGKYPIPNKATILQNSKYGSKKAFISNTNDLVFYKEIYVKIESNW